MKKPVIRIPASKDAPQIKALMAFAVLNEASAFHKQRDCRHPLGVYNMSLQRISKNVSRCSDRLEEFWTSTGANDEILEEVVDYLELALYSAAEHVDDVNRIAMTFFESDVQAKNSKDFRLLKGRIRPLRSEISSFTNTIKHAHGRVRLYRVNFVHGNVASDLIGFFIEGFKDGSCGPSPILHTDGKKIISITSFLWNILTFLSEVSCVLYDFLLSVRAFDANDIERIEHEPFQVLL